MKIKFKKLTMGIFIGLGLMYANNNEVQAGGDSIAFITYGNSVNLKDIDTSKFDNDTDLMYYNVFGENFKVMQQASEQINKTAYYDDIKMEVLSTVTITEEGSLFYTSYTFFTLQDVTSNNRITNSMFLDIQNEITKDNISMFSVNAIPINFDEETQTKTYVAIYSHYDTETYNYLEHITLNITNIIDNYTTDNILINNVNIDNITSTHNPSFINNITSGGSSSVQFQELDLDFDELFESDTLKKDELSIPIDSWECAYISNIALMENMLHIQASTPEIYNNMYQWYSLDLINSKTDNVISPLYSIRLDNRDEDLNSIDNRVYEEFVFLIDNIDNLTNYNLNLDRSYYATSIDTNLQVAFSAPVLKYSYKTGKETEILINDQMAKVSNINISLMGINFTIDSIEVMEKGVRNVSEYIQNNIDVILIYNNGEEQAYSVFGNEQVVSNNIVSWSHEDNEHVISNIVISSDGTVIDVDNLVAININGTIIEVN